MPIDYDTLDAAGRDATAAAVRVSHSRMVELEVSRRDDGRPVMSLTRRFLGGTIQGDLSRDVVTYLEADLLDPDNDLDWTHGAHRRYEVRVIDYRYVPALGDWVAWAAFTGPMWTFDRDGARVHLVAHGPERNALGTIRDPDPIPAKARATTVLRGFLAKAGAKPSQLRIPDLKRTLPRPVTVGVKVGPPPKDDKKDNRRTVRRLVLDREDTYLGEARPIAQALGRDLIADALGRFWLLTRKQRPVVSLTARQLLAPVTVRRGGDGEQPNTWIVTGPNPKGPRGRPHARVPLPVKHPASAQSLAWNGTPRVVAVEVENKHVRTDKQARKLGERLRDQAAREPVEYEVQALPVVGWWQPYTSATFPVGGGRATALVPSWQLPLGPAADPMVLGLRERVRYKK